MNQKYTEFIEHFKELGGITSNGSLAYRRLPIKKASKAKNRMLFEMEEQLKELTFFLAQDTPSKKRLSFVRYGIDETNFQCAVPGCTNPREYHGSFFSKICHVKDQKHKDYRGQLKAQGGRKTFQEKYGVDNISQLKETKEKKRKTFQKNYNTDNVFATKEFKENNKRQLQENYGVVNVSQIDKIKIKKKETCLANYGVDVPLKSPEIKERAKQTNKEKYGYDWSLSSPEVRKRGRQTNIERYGYGNPFESSEVKERIKQTNKEKYGYECILSSPETQERIKQTTLERYGYEYATQSPEVKERIKQTTLERYGAGCKLPDYYNMENYKKLNKEFITENFIDERKYVKVKEFKEFIGMDGTTTVFNYVRKHQVVYNPKCGRSRAEEEIAAFIKTIAPDTEIILNSRKIIPPKELDIYLPEYNLAIEYDGLMYHSQGIAESSRFNTPNQSKEKHLEKTEACEAKGIALLHIFESEWTDEAKCRIWKSVIQNKLHKNPIRLFARKLVVLELNSKRLKNRSAELFKNNHLQGGGAIGPISFGLFDGGELISCMTFGKSRFHKETVYELIRFATIKNVSVAGGASRLLKAFERTYKPDKLISYANRRWSDGNLYKKLGFTLSHISEPNYFYFKPENILKLWSRNHFQKHKLPDYFPDMDMTGLIESEIMFAQGYRRIFDSGNYSFMKTYT